MKYTEDAPLFLFDAEVTCELACEVACEVTPGRSRRKRKREHLQKDRP